MLRKATVVAAVLTMVALPSVSPSPLSPTPAHADDRHGPGGVLFKILRAVTGETRRIDENAVEVYEAAPRIGSCEDRRARILALLPDALRLARLSRDIDADKHAPEMRAKHLTTLDLGDGRTAHYQANGKRYAEVIVDEQRREAVVVFQGTRLEVKSDVTTDVANFIGLKSGYHSWAAALVGQVAREHPDFRVIVTGHSLGGGLAIYAVLKNPGVKGFAFNPAGLSLITWRTAGGSNRARTSAALTVVSTRNDRHIEPVTALSLAGRSVLPGHILVLDTDANGPVSLHASATVVQALERVEASGAAGSVCKGDLGELVD